MKEAETFENVSGGHSKPEPKGIGGWLILPALGLIIAPVTSTLILLVGMDTVQSFMPRHAGDPRLWFAMSIEVAMIIAQIIVAVLFFQRRRAAVRGIIGLIIASLLADRVLDLIISSMFSSMGSRLQPNSSMAWGLLSAAIWIPYFLNAKRVKNTFTVGA